MTSADAILVLDGHTNQALACVRSLGRAGYRALVASHRRSPLAAWSRYCRSCFRLRGETIEAYAEARSWAHKQGVTIVLPLTERACVLCNAERQRWEECGITVGCGPDEMLRGAFDKALTLCRAEACGVSITAHICSDVVPRMRAAADAVGFPCVVKPRWSNAWDGTSFLPTHSPSYVIPVVILISLFCRSNKAITGRSSRGLSRSGQRGIRLMRPRPGGGMVCS